MTWMCQCPTEHPDTIPVCGSCLTDRPARAVAVKHDCHDCLSDTRGVQLVPGDDALLRCASCHMAYLRQRADRDPITPADFAATRKLVQDLALNMGDLEAPHPADSTPGVLERIDTPDHPFPKRRFPRASSYFSGMR